MNTATSASTTATLASPIAWFEIPVRDMARAQNFYETLLGVAMQREPMGDKTLAVFPHPGDGAGGCLLAGAEIPAPSSNGTLVYLSAAPSLDAVLARVEAAGGRITTPKVQLPAGMGWFAHVADTEGNRVGLHAAA